MLIGPLGGGGNIVGVGRRGQNLRQQRVRIKRDARHQLIQLCGSERRGGGAWAKTGAATIPARTTSAAGTFLILCIFIILQTQRRGRSRNRFRRCGSSAVKNVSSESITIQLWRVRHTKTRSHLRNSSPERGLKIYNQRRSSSPGIRHQRIEQQLEILITLAAILRAHAEQDHVPLPHRDVEQRRLPRQIFLAQQPARREHARGRDTARPLAPSPGTSHAGLCSLHNVISAGMP